MKEIREFVKKAREEALLKGYTEHEAMIWLFDCLRQVDSILNNPLQNNDIFRNETSIALKMLSDFPSLKTWFKEDDFLSWIYQFYCYIYNQNIQSRKGMFYTPKWLVNYIVQSSCNYFLNSKDTLGIESIKILDPACGERAIIMTQEENFDKSRVLKLYPKNIFNNFRKIILSK